MTGDLASQLLAGSDDAQDLPGAKFAKTESCGVAGRNVGSSTNALASFPAFSGQQPSMGPTGSGSCGAPVDQSQMQQLLSVVLSQQQQMQQMMGYITSHLGGRNDASLPVQHDVKPPAGGSTTIIAPEPPVPTVDEKLSPQIVSHIKKVARGFAKSTNKYIYAASMEKRMSERLEVMKEGMRYPPGVKPFASPVELLELGTALEESVDADYSETITFPRGTTRREAMKMMHHRVAVFNTTMYRRSYQERATTLKPGVTHAQYLLACNTPADSSDTTEIDLLGLDAPTTLKLPNAAKARELAESQYAAIMNRLQEKLKKQNDASKEASAERKKSQDELESADVEQLLPIIIRNVVKTS